MLIIVSLGNCIILVAVTLCIFYPVMEIYQKISNLWHGIKRKVCLAYYSENSCLMPPPMSHLYISNDLFHSF